MDLQTGKHLKELALIYLYMGAGEGPDSGMLEQVCRYYGHQLTHSQAVPQSICKSPFLSNWHSCLRLFWPKVAAQQPETLSRLGQRGGNPQPSGLHYLFLDLK